MIKEGQIIKIIAGFFDVKTNNNIYRLRASGTLRDSNQIPLVGDYVEFRNDSVLIKIKERKNSLIRPKVANIDQIAIVTSLNEPKFSSILLDKFLAIIEFQNIKPIILFTKSDIGNQQPYFDYLKQGYESYLVNNLDKEFDFDNLRTKFKNKLSVFTGQSGVGKTSTLNNLLYKLEKTDNISKALGRGKHTTRVTEIFTHDNISIIDTPGFSSIEINLSQQELSKSFFDFREWSKKCKYRSCLHYKEIDCEIKKQLSLKNLLESRYDNYIKMLKEIK